MLVSENMLYTPSFPSKRRVDRRSRVPTSGCAQTPKAVRQDRIGEGSVHFKHETTRQAPPSLPASLPALDTPPLHRSVNQRQGRLFVHRRLWLRNGLVYAPAHPNGSLYEIPQVTAPVLTGHAEWHRSFVAIAQADDKEIPVHFGKTGDHFVRGDLSYRKESLCEPSYPSLAGWFP